MFCPKCHMFGGILNRRRVEKMNLGKYGSIAVWFVKRKKVYKGLKEYEVTET